MEEMSRGLTGRGHFYTQLTSFRREAFYDKKKQENVNFNAHFIKVHAFLKVNNSIASKNTFKSFRPINLIGNLLTFQPHF